MGRGLRLPQRLEALLPTFLSNWTAVGRRTGPADRPCTEVGLKLVYGEMGLPMPRCRWVVSPLAAVRILQEDLGQGDVPGAPTLPDPLASHPVPRRRSALSRELYQHLTVEIQDGIRASIERAILNEVGPAARRHLHRAWHGQHDANRMALVAFRQEALDRSPTPRLDTGLVLLAQSAGWLWPMREVCIISERPRTLHLDLDGRLHNESGPALSYPGGWSIYAWHGELLPPHVIESPQRITTGEILEVSNAELRRFYLERAGIERLVEEGVARSFQRDECGELYRWDAPGDEPVVLVRVVNSTPEPDGSRRRYVLRVPPDIRTARQAVAWTFGMAEGQYRPSVQT